MADKIEFVYNGSTYIMEFDRKSIVRAEENLGLGIKEMQEMGISTFPKLFHAALLKHHPRIKESTVDMLYGKMSEKNDLLQTLGQMYADVVQSLFEEPAEGEAISWTMA